MAQLLLLFVTGPELLKSNYECCWSRAGQRKRAFEKEGNPGLSKEVILNIL